MNNYIEPPKDKIDKISLTKGIAWELLDRKPPVKWIVTSFYGRLFKNTNVRILFGSSVV